MICKCGYQNEPDDFYCAQCGRKLGRKKGGKGWIIAIVAVLLVAALVVGAWFLFRDKLVDPEPTETTEDGNVGTPNEPGGVRPGEDVDSGETHADGWNEEKTHYYRDGEALKGRQEIDGEYYCFSEEDGRMLTGWQQIGDDWYYYTDEGPAPGEGWYENDNGWFYLEADGRQRTKSEEFKDPNRIFELDEEGYLVSTTYLTLQCKAEKVAIGAEERDVLMLPGTITGCKQFDFTMTKVPGIDLNAQSFEADVWVCRNGIWDSEEGAEVRKSESGSGFTLTFDEPQDISGIYIGLKNKVIAYALLTNFKAVK